MTKAPKTKIAKTKAPVDPAKAAAAKKKVDDQIAADQKWVDTQTANMTPLQKQEMFNEISKSCAQTTMSNGKIVLACPLKAKLIYCMPGDPFDCPNGKVKGGGCKLSSNVSQALAKTSKIDGVFVSKEEGGSYCSPYVPWGPIQGKNGKPVLTSGNSSGVTVGTGVDLGAIKPDQKQAYLDRLEKAGVSKTTRDTIEPFIGKKREDACDALRTARNGQPMVLDSHDVELIDQDAMESRAPGLKSQYNRKLKLAQAGYAKKIAAATKAGDAQTAASLAAERDGLRDFDTLDGNEQSILFSTYYHQGSINGAANTSFVNAAMAGDSSAERAALVVKSENANGLLASRGQSELDYFDAQAAPVESAPTP